MSLLLTVYFKQAFQNIPQQKAIITMNRLFVNNFYMKSWPFFISNCFLQSLLLPQLFTFPLLRCGDFFPLQTFLSQTFNFYIPNLNCTHPLPSSYYNIQYILSPTFSLY